MRNAILLILLLLPTTSAYLYDDFSDGFLDPELWEESVGDKSLEHVEYHFESQNENTYHTIKLNVSGSTAVEGHRVSLSKTASATGNWGFKFVPNTDLRIKGASKSGNSGATTVYLIDSDGSVLQSATFTGTHANLDYPLQKHKNYYIVSNKGGGTYIFSHQDVGLVFPYNNPAINITAGYEHSTRQELDYQIGNMVSIDVDAPDIYGVEGTRLSLTQPLQPGDKLEYTVSLDETQNDHQSHLVFNNLTLFRRMHEIDNFTCGGFAGCGFFGEWNGANLWGKETGNYSISIDFNEDSADINIIKPSEDTIYYKTRNLQPPFTFGIETRASADGLIHADYDNFYINSQPPEQEANLTVTLTPHQTRITPEESLSYTVNITNHADKATTFDAHSTLNPGQLPVLKGNNVKIYGQTSILRTYTHEFPCHFSTGNYTYTIYIEKDNQTIDSDNFTFELIPEQMEMNSRFHTILK